LRAVEISGPREARLIEVPEPGVDDGRVLVRMRKVAICGSDLPYFTGSTFHVESYPLEPGRVGHECIGVVEESAVPEFSPGDVVLVLPPSAAGLVDYISVGPHQLVKLPADEDPDRILMTQVLGTVVHCCYKLDNVVGQTVAIVGQGPIGLLFSGMMRNLGARKIIGIDLLDYRLEKSLEMGATHTVNAGRSDPVEAVREITDGGMADTVIEAVGSEETVNTSIDMASHGGLVVIFGVPKVEFTGVRLDDFLRKELRMMASVGPDREKDYKFALELILQGRIDVSKLITHHIPFSEIQHAYEIAAERLDGAIKVVVDIDS